MYNYLIINGINDLEKIIFDKKQCAIIELQKWKDYVKIKDCTKECFKLLKQKKRYDWRTIFQSTNQ